MRNTRAERESFLSAGRFKALLKALVGAWLDAGYAPAAVAAAEQAVACGLPLWRPRRLSEG
jgi:hypothetical protein